LKSKRGREGGDLRGVRILLDFLLKNLSCSSPSLFVLDLRISFSGLIFVWILRPHFEFLMRIRLVFYFHPKR
jgi:hypothetical protein